MKRRAVGHNLLPRTEDNHDHGISHYDELRASLLHDDGSQQAVVEEREGSSILKVTTANSEAKETIVRLMHVACALGLSIAHPETGQIIPLQHIYPSAKGAMMAAHDFNTRSSAVVPDLEDRLSNCNVKMTVDFYDTQRQIRHGAAMTSQHIHKRGFPYETTAVMGSSRSSVSLPMAILNSARHIPQISYSATSASLDNRGTYPFFGRVIPSDHGDATALADFLSQQTKSTHVGILYVDDEYGNAYRLALEIAAARLGIATQSIAIRSRLTDNPAEQGRGSVASAISQILDSGLRHFVGIIFTQHLRELVVQGSPQGVFGPERFWLFTDGARPLRDRFPAGSPMADALQGMAFLANGAGIVGGRHEGFVQRYRDLNENQEFMRYFESKTPRASDVVKFTSNFSFADSGDPSVFVAYAYDSIMALGISACRASSEFVSGSELMEEFKQVSFMGASGNVTIERGSASRHHNTSAYIVYNTLQTKPDEEGMVGDAGMLAASYAHGQWQSMNGGFNFSDKTLIPPPPLPPLIQEHTFDRVTNIFFTAMACVLVFSATAFAIWTWVYRESYVVKAAQPGFLLVICLGAVSMSFTLIFLGSEYPPHSYWWANFSCMGSWWFFCLGFGLAFSALLAKTWRIVRIMKSGRRCRRIVVRSRDVALPAVLIVLGNFIVLLTWQLYDPLRFHRVDDQDGSVDEYGRWTETIAFCYGEKGFDMYFLMVLFCLNFGTVVAANIQAWRARHITTEFSESWYIGLAIAILLQANVLSLPVFFLGAGTGAAGIAERMIVLIAVSSILFLIFVPKIGSWLLHEKQRGPRTFVHGLQHESNKKHTLQANRGSPKPANNNNTEVSLQQHVSDGCATDSPRSEADQNPSCPQLSSSMLCDVEDSGGVSRPFVDEEERESSVRALDQMISFFDDDEAEDKSSVRDPDHSSESPSFVDEEERESLQREMFTCHHRGSDSKNENSEHQVDLSVHQEDQEVGSSAGDSSEGSQSSTSVVSGDETPLLLNEKVAAPASRHQPSMDQAPSVSEL